MNKIGWDDIACWLVLVAMVFCVCVMFLRVAAVDADDVSGLTREQREAIYRQPVRLRDIKED